MATDFERAGQLALAPDGEPHRPRGGGPVATRTMVAPPLPPAHTWQPPPVLGPRRRTGRRRRRRIARSRQRTRCTARPCAFGRAITAHCIPWEPPTPPRSVGRPRHHGRTSGATGGRFGAQRIVTAPRQVTAIMGTRGVQVASSADTLSTPVLHFRKKGPTGPYEPGDQAATQTPEPWVRSSNICGTSPAPKPSSKPLSPSRPPTQPRRCSPINTRKWSACAGRTFTLSLPNETPHRWTFSPLTIPDGRLRADDLQEKAQAMPDVGVLAARNNVIIDVGAPSSASTRKASTSSTPSLRKSPYSRAHGPRRCAPR